MAKLEWDQPGSHVYQRGTDRGVLYLPDGSAVPWNGLKAVDEGNVDAGSTSYHYDGVKYFNHRQPGDFTAKLRAITYPDEFEQFEGYVATDQGVLLGNQPVDEYFGLSYRTLVGNEIDGDGFAYKLHLLYNLTAVADGKNYGTISDGTDLSEFGWDISGIPVDVPGHRPAVHVILDTRRINKYAIMDIEDILYGDDQIEPRLLTPVEIHDHVAAWIPLIITDHGDGTFTAEGSDEDIQQLEATKYSIEADSAKTFTNGTFEISSEI